jgi:hypothetical protein
MMQPPAASAAKHLHGLSDNSYTHAPQTMTARERGPDYVYAIERGFFKNEGATDMRQGTQPQVFQELITQTAGLGGRYLELQKANGRYQLRALFANSWKVLDIAESDATEIWNWATGSIRARTPKRQLSLGRQPLRALEMVGRFSPDSLSRRSLTRLTLRLMGSSGQDHLDSGTLAMRMKDLQV